MVSGRTKGLKLRGKGNVVLVAAQLDDADGNPTEEYVLLRADEFGRLRTVDGGAGVSAFLGLTDTPGAYAGAALQNVRVNAAADALEFAAASAANENDRRQVKGLAPERWSLPGWHLGDQAAVAAVAGRLTYTPFLVPQTRTYIRMGIVVTGAGAGGTVARLGIYNGQLDADGLTPSTLVVDGGTVAVDGVAAVEVVISESLTPGWYFVAFVTDGAPTVSTLSTVQGVTPPVSGFGQDLTDGSGGDMDLTQLFVAGQGVGALGDPAVAPTTVVDTFRDLYVRLRDI